MAVSSNGTSKVAPFDAESLRIVRYSAGRLTPLAGEFTRRLHQDIVALSPTVAVSMTQAGRLFCERMARALIWVALTDEPLNVMIDVLGRVGADNQREGFPESEYVNVAQALVRTIRDLTDSDWVTSMGSAWISCFMWMQPHLLAGARQAAVLAEGDDPLSTPAGRPPYPREPGPPAAPPDDDDEVGYRPLTVWTLNPRRDRLPKD